jgi:hypothetical protein
MDNVKKFDKFINEIEETFFVDEIISYNYEYTDKVVKVHEGYELLDIILYNPKAAVMNKPSTVSSTLCIKFEQL